jgi:hypothetical protein
MTLTPRDPFLFFRRPPHWRWLSFREVGAAVALWGKELSRVPAATRVGVAGGPGLDALLADLAVRSVGLVAVPLGLDPDGLAADPAEAGFEAIVAPEDIELDAPGAVPVIRLPARPRCAEGLPREEIEQPAGGCLVAAGEGRQWWREIGPSQLARRVEEAALLLDGRAQRPVLVHAESLAAPWERLIVEWAIGAAAVLIVESDPAQAAGTAFWARPSMIHGPAARLDAWTAAFAGAESGSRGRRRRFGRVRALVCCDEGPLDQATVGFWEPLEVPILRLPSL